MNRRFAPAAGALPPTATGTARRRWCLAAGSAAALALAGCGTPPRLAWPPAPTPGGGTVPPLSGTPGPDGLPAGWAEHVMRRDRAPTRYEPVEHDGRRAVHAVADSATSGLRCDVDIDPEATPWLHWSWQVAEVPDDATVAVDERDDSPARVVIAFDGDLGRLSLRDRLFHEQVELFTGQPLPYATLMYTWDGAAPVGTVLHYPRSSRIRYLVVEQGSAAAGHWRHYRRHVADDYRRVFGEPPGRIRHVGILTDSDDLKRHLEAWFCDLDFSAG